MPLGYTIVSRSQLPGSVPTLRAQSLGVIDGLMDGDSLLAYVE